MPLERIHDGDDLTLRCIKCFENLYRCVKAAEIAEQVNYSFTKSILAPHPQHHTRAPPAPLHLDVQLRRSRRQICPSSFRPTRAICCFVKSLESTFARIDDSTKSLFEALKSMSSLAKQAYQSTDDRYARRNRHLPESILTAGSTFLDPIRTQGAASRGAAATA